MNRRKYLKRFEKYEPRPLPELDDGPNAASKARMAAFDRLPKRYREAVANATIGSAKLCNEIWYKLQQRKSHNAIMAHIERRDIAHASQAEKESAQQFLKELGL